MFSIHSCTSTSPQVATVDSGSNNKAGQGDFTGSILISASKDGRLKGWHSSLENKALFDYDIDVSIYCQVRIMVETLSLVAPQMAKYLLGKLAGPAATLKKIV